MPLASCQCEYSARVNDSRVIDVRLQCPSTTSSAGGWRLALIDANDNRMSFAYDAAGRELARMNPLSQRTSFAYNACGRQTLRIDARGNRTTYAYDANGQRTGRRYPDATRATFTYDANGNLTRMDDWTGATTQAYDARDQVSSIVNPDDKRLTYTYDAAARRSTLVDPEAGATTYTYDAGGRLTGVVNELSETTTLAYDAAGQQIQKKLDNGTWTSLTWDAAGRQTDVANYKSDNSVLSTFDYAYDNVGNRTRVAEDTGDRVTWTYDNTYQLLSEHRGGASGYRHTFTWDPVGNRLTADDGTAVTTYAYDAANRLDTADDASGVTTYVFDATGNQRSVEEPSGDVTTYAWTYENQMALIEKPDATLVTYTYAPVTRRADEFRVTKETDADTLHYIWDSENILRETDDVGTVQAQYTLTPQAQPEPYSALISQRRDTESSFYHFDALGSTRALTDDTETETDDYAYEAFGDVASSSGATTNPYQWIGQKGYYSDEDSSLYSLRRREYTPGEGRFISEDPIGPVAGDANLYRYVGNNAINATDPSGLDRIVSGTSSQVQEAYGRSYNSSQYFLSIDRPGFWRDFESTVYIGAASGNGIRVGAGTQFCNRNSQTDVCQTPCVMSFSELNNLFANSFPNSAHGETGQLKGKSGTHISNQVMFFLNRQCSGREQMAAGLGDASFISAFGHVLKEEGCEVIETGLAFDLCGLVSKARSNCGSVLENFMLLIDALPKNLGDVRSILGCLAEGAMTGVKDAFTSLKETGQTILKDFLSTLGIDPEFDLAALIGGDISQVLNLLGLSIGNMVGLLRETARDVFQGLYDRWEPVIEPVVGVIHSIFTNGLQATLDNLVGAATDKIADLKESASNIWEQITGDFGGFLVDNIVAAVPTFLQAAVRQVTPLKFLNVLNIIVDVCGSAAMFLEKATEAVQAARECTTSAVSTIAGATKSIMTGAASALLGGLIGILLGNLPRLLVRKLCELKEGIKDLIKKLMKMLLEKIKDLFGRRGAQGQTDAEGIAPGCPAFELRNGETAQRPQAAGGRDQRRRSRCETSSCIVAGTPVSVVGGRRPIETLTPGSRVRTFLPDERNFIGTEYSEFDRGDLRLVQLHLTRSDGSECRFELLRSHDWIEDYGAHVGGSVFLDMPEMGVEGQAEVLAIEPCPPLEEGEGRLVTGTFKHTSGEVYDLKLESENEPIGVTATHPFWSVDREAWVSAIDLEIGETLKTLAGTTVVESRSKREEPETVYNIEVEGDHVYRVGVGGVLVHNMSQGDPSPGDERGDCSPCPEEYRNIFGEIGIPVPSTVPTGSASAILQSLPPWKNRAPARGILVVNGKAYRLSSSNAVAPITAQQFPGFTDTNWFHVEASAAAIIWNLICNGEPVESAVLYINLIPCGSLDDPQEDSEGCYFKFNHMLPLGIPVSTHWRQYGPGLTPINPADEYGRKTFTGTAQ